MVKKRTQEPGTFAWRLALAMEKRGVNQKVLASGVGMQQPSISKLLRRPSSGTTAIARLADYLNVPARWLELGEGPEPDWDASHPHAGGTYPGGWEAHHLIHQLPIIDPLVITLELIMSGAVLAKRFMLKIEDDSMAFAGTGSLEPGHFAIFETDREPFPGRNVLLRDKTGLSASASTMCAGQGIGRPWLPILRFSLWTASKTAWWCLRPRQGTCTDRLQEDSP